MHRAPTELKWKKNNNNIDCAALFSLRNCAFYFRNVC